MSVVQLTVQVNDPPGGSSPWLGVSPMAIPFPPTTYGAATVIFGFASQAVRHNFTEACSFKIGRLFVILVHVQIFLELAFLGVCSMLHWF